MPISCNIELAVGAELFKSPCFKISRHRCLGFHIVKGGDILLFRLDLLRVKVPSLNPTRDYDKH